jgi:4-hydroxybutyrate CoA-transferase
MHWDDLYRSKLTTADQALKAVKPGDSVYVHNGCAQPVDLVDALVRRAPELRDVNVVHMMTLGRADYTDPKYEGIFRHIGFFLGPNVRQAIRECRADYVPIFLSEVESVFESGQIPVDVALLQCTPPDEYGYVSLGTSIDITHSVLKVAKHVIFEVNDRCPRTHGQTSVHVRQANAIVEVSHPLPEYCSGEVNDVHRKIAHYVANLIPDGAVLQIGIGAMPATVLENLKSHKDLGIHTELFSDGVIDLMEAGVINNARKTIHPHKCLTGFVLGSKRLFHFVHNNPNIEFRPTSYVNDPFLIAQNERMVAVNSAIEIDLTGQVVSDSIGPYAYSGIGGQVDFIRGAARSKGGLPIISLPSTTKNDTISRVVPVLKPGAGVVTSRGDVHYVVTEYGVAYLHGKSFRQRAEALIEIAHPKFRDELTRAAESMGLLRTATRSQLGKAFAG